MPTLEEFIWEMQRNALLFGMNLKDFWLGNPQLFYLYKDFYIEKIRIKRIQDNQFAWEQGTYILQAFRQGLNDSLSNRKQSIYPKEPYKLKEENKNDNDFENKMFDVIMAKAKIINQKLKK